MVDVDSQDSQALQDLQGLQDHKWMQRALDLAAKGAGRVSPNPMVGAVITRKGQCLGEGYHGYYGGPHAEIVAIEDAKAKGHSLSGATLYVTLEPCCHYGKTPPCVEAILSEGFSRVVVAMADPNPLVAGKGLEKLREAGIATDTGIMEAKARKLNEAFIKYITTKMPFVVFKAALTLDGKIATTTGDSKWISGETSRALVHQWRSESDLVMVGIGTVLADDPLLTVRSLPGEVAPSAALKQLTIVRQPHRLVVDPWLDIPKAAKLLSLTDGSTTYIACSDQCNPQRAKALVSESLGKVELLPQPEKDGHLDLQQLMVTLGQAGISRVLLEGGAGLGASALKAGIVDKLAFYLAPKLLGGQGAPGPIGNMGIETLAAAMTLEAMTHRAIGEDVLIEAYIKK